MSIADEEMSSMTGRRATERQLRVLRFVYTYSTEHGAPPTLREIGAAMGIRSTNGVNDHLKALARKGLLELRGFKSRGMRVTIDGLIALGHDIAEGERTAMQCAADVARENSRLRMILRAVERASLAELPVILNQIRAELGGAA